MPTKRAPPLSALRSFEAAARHLSFAAAAQELFVTPAAVSQQVKRLEEHLRLQLFERRHRSVALTEKGAELAATLQTLFAELDRALIRITATAEQRIHVSALPSLAAKWLAPRLHRFESAFPAVRLKIDTNDRLVDFAHDAVDVGLRYGAGKYRGLHVERWMSAEAFPVCSPVLLKNSRRTLKAPDDLRRHTLLHDASSERGKGIPDWTTWLRAAGASHVDSRSGPVFDSIHLALEAAIAGHGVALAVAPLVAHEISVGRLVRPFELALPNAYSFWIVCQRKRAKEAAIRNFIRWLHQEGGAKPS